MAGPLVLAGEAIASGGARSAMRAGAAKIKDMLISLGLWEGFQAAVEYAPDVLDAMYASLADSGASPDVIAATRDQGRKVLLIEAARQGVALDSAAGLSRKELAGYAKLLSDFGFGMRKDHDDNQVERKSSGNAMVDDAAVLGSMARVCNRLGLTGPNRFRQLYEVAMVLNSVRESDVEKAELHERLYGSIR